jgi:hypothetical protein
VVEKLSGRQEFGFALAGLTAAEASSMVFLTFVRGELHVVVLPSACGRLVGFGANFR